MFELINLIINRPENGPAVISTTDNLIILHFREKKVSFSVDIASVPFDSAGNVTLPAAVRNAVAKLHIRSLFDDEEDVKKSVDDPAFKLVEQENTPYHSYEVTISSPSIGMELESTFQQ